MSYTEINYIVSTNEDWRDALTLEDDDGPVDLTGSEFIAHIRTSENALAIVLVASTDNGRLVIADDQADTGKGVVAWNVPESVLRLIEPGEYVYDIVWRDGDGTPDMIAGGLVEIVRGITRE